MLFNHSKSLHEIDTSISIEQGWTNFLPLILFLHFCNIRCYKFDCIFIHCPTHEVHSVVQIKYKSKRQKDSQYKFLMPSVLNNICLFVMTLTDLEHTSYITGMARRADRTLNFTQTTNHIRWIVSMTSILYLGEYHLVDLYCVEKKFWKNIKYWLVAVVSGLYFESHQSSVFCLWKQTGLLRFVIGCVTQMYIGLKCVCVHAFVCVCVCVTSLVIQDVCCADILRNFLTLCHQWNK